jgi:hypothetical protein
MNVFDRFSDDRLEWELHWKLFERILFLQIMKADDNKKKGLNLIERNECMCNTIDSNVYTNYIANLFAWFGRNQ